MFQGVKNIFSGEDINEKLKAHSELLVKQNEILEALQQSLKGVTSELTNFKQEHLVLQQVFDTNLDKVKQLKGEFHREIDDFKILKNKLHEVVGDRVISGLDDKLSVHLERLKTDVQHFNMLKDSIAAVGGSLDELRTEVSRLKSVAGQIKAGDFELTKFMNKVAEQDRNKLELMQKIETLEKLIAHERRKH